MGLTRSRGAYPGATSALGRPDFAGTFESRIRLSAVLPGIEIDVVDPPGRAVARNELERDRVRCENSGQVREQQTEARGGLPRRVRRDLAAVENAQDTEQALDADAHP